MNFVVNIINCLIKQTIFVFLYPNIYCLHDERTYGQNGVVREISFEASERDLKKEANQKYFFSVKKKDQIESFF